MSEQARGIFIVLEGVDGAGKSTQLELLRQALSSVGYDVVTSREPTDGVWGRKIRESATRGRMPLEEELDAFIRDRKEHIATVIGPGLQQGKIVLVDRYFYSTIAYQGVRGADVRMIEETMRDFAPIPDFVLLLDANPEITLTRISEDRGDTPDEFEHIESLRRIRQRFLSLAEQCPEMFRVDAHQPIAALQASLLRVLSDESQQRAATADPVSPACPFRGGPEPWSLLHVRLSEYLARQA